MKTVVFSVESSGMGKKVIRRDPTGRKRIERRGRGYVRVVLGIFVQEDDIPRLTEMSSVLGDKIETAVEMVVNEIQPEKRPGRKIVT